MEFDTDLVGKLWVYTMIFLLVFEAIGAKGRAARKNPEEP